MSESGKKIFFGAHQGFLNPDKNPLNLKKEGLMRALKWILVNTYHFDPKIVQLRYGSGEIAYEGSPLLRVDPGSSSQDTPKYSWVIPVAVKHKIDRDAVIDALNQRSRGRTNIDDATVWTAH